MSAPRPLPARPSHEFERKAAGMAQLSLVQQGAELAYLLLHDPEFRSRVRKHHLTAVGQRVGWAQAHLRCVPHKGGGPGPTLVLWFCPSRSRAKGSADAVPTLG